MSIYSDSGHLVKAISVDFGAIVQELRGHDASIGCEFAYFQFLMHYLANAQLPVDQAKLKRIGRLIRLPSELGEPDQILDEFLQLDSLTLIPAFVDKETGEELQACYHQCLWQSFIDGAVDSYNRKVRQTEPGRLAAAAGRKSKQAAQVSERLASKADGPQESTSK